VKRPARHDEHAAFSGPGAMLLAGLACLAAGCSTAPSSQQVPVWLGQTAGPNAPIVPMKVTSWQDLKFKGLVRQRTDFSCGAAVLATVFNEAYGHQTTEQQVLVNMLRVADPDIVREKGFSMLDMKNYARALGMSAEGYRVDYAALQKLQVPAIALINIKGYKHFVVVRKAYADHIAIGDPALGNRVMTRPAFETAWNDVAFIVLGSGYDPDNALINPPPPLSARRLMEVHSMIPAATAAEFGVGPYFQFSF